MSKILLAASTVVLPLFLAIAPEAGAEDAAISPFAIGYQTCTAQDGFSGISMKIKLSDAFRFQPIFWLDSRGDNGGDDLLTYGLGVRGVYDLKTKSGINRYTGIGLGVARKAVYLYDEVSEKGAYSYSNARSVQAFLGLEFPSTIWTFLLSWFGKAPPLDASVELGLGVSLEDSHVRPRTAVNFGVHYGF